jgi:hypothetical protein
MSGWKTSLTLLCAVLVASAVPAQAEPMPRTAEARLTLFAQCAGRFSAQMEHAWLFSRDGRGAQAGQAGMVELIEVLAPVAALSGKEVLGLRIDAKMAHAALLGRAAVAADARARSRAQARADAQLARCAGLLPRTLAIAALR